MTREEFIEDNKYHINAYGNYYTGIMRNKYPDFIFAYKTAPSSVSGISYYTIKDKYVTYIYAYSHDIQVINEIVGFYCTSYGCVPLFKKRG